MRTLLPLAGLPVQMHRNRRKRSATSRIRARMAHRPRQNASRGSQPRHREDVATFNAYAHALIVEKIGIWLPIQSYVRSVWGPVQPGGTKRKLVLVIALYDNYQTEYGPSREEIEEIRAAFGFEGKPKWFPDASQLIWRYT